MAATARIRIHPRLIRPGLERFMASPPHPVGHSSPARNVSEIPPQGLGFGHSLDTADLLHSKITPSGREVNHGAAQLTPEERLDGPVDLKSFDEAHAIYLHLERARSLARADDDAGDIGAVGLAQAGERE